MPAGAAWQAALKRDPYLALYGPDGFHPSPLGSFLAAWIIFERLYGGSFETSGGSLEMPRKLKIESEMIKQIEISPSQLETLRLAALEANGN